MENKQKSLEKKLLKVLLEIVCQSNELNKETYCKVNKALKEADDSPKAA